LKSAASSKLRVSTLRDESKSLMAISSVLTAIEDELPLCYHPYESLADNSGGQWGFQLMEAEEAGGL
jgi:hypothetical protein